MPDSSLDLSSPYSELNGHTVATEHLRAILDFEFDDTPKTQRDKDLLWATYLAIYGTEEDLNPTSALGVEIEETDQSASESPTNFSLTESLTYLKRIEELRAYAPQAIRTELLTLTKAELKRLNTWLRASPGEQRAVAEEIEAWAHVGFPYEVLNEGLGKTLVVSYAFAPDMDTAGMVMARRIRTWGQVVSVMSNDLSATNKYDPECFQMCAPFVERQIKINAKPTVFDWHRISWFVRKGMKYIDQNPHWFAQHDHLYSRVMQPPSHFLAAMIKLENPDIKWTAEFSDPLSRGVRNEVKYARLTPAKDDPVFQAVRDHIEQSGLLEIANDNLLLWDELLAYSLADELVFANERHHQYMVENVPDFRLQERVASISRADPHPPPPKRFYDVAESPIVLDKTKINIGYLGYFYDTRRLAELTDALELLSPKERDEVAITFIGKNPLDVLERNGVDVDTLNIEVYPPVTYFEALAMQKDFDYLIVNDASTKENFDYNIYLPSKYSDMIHGHSKVWGITEPGSLIDFKSVDVKSHIGDVDGALNALRQILKEAKS